MKAVLLAAGRGKRLQPLTDDRPKPLIEVGGRPILEWILMGMKQAGIREIAVITGHLGERLKAYFGSGKSLDMQLAFYPQEIQDGTARAVLPAESFLDDAPFLLGYGDIIVPPDTYTKMIAMHRIHPQDSVLAAREVDDPSSCGALAVRNGKLVDIVEKPAPGKAPGNLINAGIMILQPEILDHIRKVPPSPRGEYELTDALVSLARHTDVWIYPIPEFWSDIGTVEKLVETDRWLRNRNPSKT